MFDHFVALVLKGLNLEIVIVCLKTLFNKTSYQIETAYLHCKLLDWFIYERVSTEMYFQMDFDNHLKKQSLITVKKVF